MIDFSTLRGLTIPEGEVIQITDASGNVLWALNSFPEEPTINGVLLTSSDNYVLKDVSGLYLTSKESE